MAVRDLALPSRTITRDLSDLCENMNVNINAYSNATLRILMGQDNWNFIVTREFLRIDGFSFAISRCQLGWCVHGPVGNSMIKNTPETLCVSTCSQVFEGSNPEKTLETQALDELVRTYFQIDSLGLRREEPTNSSIKRALELLSKTSYREGNEWVTGLLWKHDEESVPDSKSRLEAPVLIGEKARSRSGVHNLYYNEMDRFIKNRYAIRISQADSNQRHWYLPHFGVSHVNEPGRVRLVFDAAAKSAGESLNDQLLSGPDLLNSLIGVLMRFRQRHIAAQGDIKVSF